MSTIRRGSRPADNLTLIANGFLRDTSVSLAARGLGAQLLSHRDGWEITTAGLAKAEGIGRDKLRGYMRELEAAGYLRRERERLSGGRLGEMLYEIHDVPQRPEKPSSNLRLDGQALDSQGLAARPHKKNIFQKINKDEKTNPSGGSSASAAGPTLEPSPIHDEEEPVTTSVDQGALFDVPAKKKTAGKRGEAPASPSAATIVAAFVDSYRQHHSGGQPGKSSIGRVARDAKGILSRGEAGPEELAQAATAMGEGPWDNLAMALKIFRDRGSRPRVQGYAPALPPTAPVWVEIAERVDAETYRKLLVDDELVAWIAGNRAEMDKWITRHPDLAERFQAVA